MAKVITSKQAAEMIKPNDRLMIGGFLAVGAPETIIDELVKTNVKDLHAIVIASDYENRGIGKLVANKQLKSAQVSHLGTNREIQAQMNAGFIDIELVPQGTLMERVRAAGAGLGGILTQTGLGTLAQEGKAVIESEGKLYILEKPINADYALVRAFKADTLGNLIYNKTARNSNPIMAMAGKITIAEVDEIVEAGQLSAEEIVTPGVFVDYLVKREA